jgi:hypothetical protein
MDFLKVQKLVFLMLSLGILSTKAYTDKTKIVIGVSQVRIEAHISENEAKEKAIELAKIDALIKKFGQYVEQESELALHSGKVDFVSYGQTKVKGEWVRTIGEPKFEYFIRNESDNPQKWISCSIKGEVRRAIPKARLQVETLSSPQKNCRTSNFVSEENMYLYIKSPIDGYLSVYLDDGNTVYRLLPYRRMNSTKAVPIKGDQEYILFSRDNPNFNTYADQLELFTNKNQEVNTLIVVFSEHEYQKPILYDEKSGKAEYITPKSLSKKAFENWLAENRSLYPDFLDLRKKVSISAQ